MKKLLVGLTAAALAVVPAAGAMAQDLVLPDVNVEAVSTAYDSADDAQVTVVHGVPGLEVDILIDGETSPITSFNYEDVATTELPAGSYTLGVAAAGTTDAILTADVTLEAGVAYVAAAHLDVDGNPVLQAYGVDDAEDGVQVFHLAQFPAVSIIAGGEIAVNDVANGDSPKVDLPGGGTLEGVGVGVAGSADAAIDLGDVTVEDGQVLLVFATGGGVEETEGDEEEVEQPTHVDSGTGGLAESGLPLWVVSLMALGALALAVPALATARRRS